MNPSGFLLFLSFLMVLGFPTAGFGKNLPNDYVSTGDPALQVAPLTLAQILTGLQTQGKTPETKTLATRNKFIAERVRQRGIAFELSPDREKDLRDAGASDELLGIIRQFSVAKLKPDPKNDKGDQKEPLKEFFKDTGSSICDKGDFDCAIAKHSKSIESKPNDAEAYAQRGEAYFNKGKTELAIKDYTKAIELKPSPDKFFRRGLAYYKKDDNESSMKDFVRALNDYKDLLKSNNSAEIHYRLGQVFFEGIGDFKEAIEAFSTAIELNPRFAEAYRFRGFVYYTQKTGSELALKDYDKAIELDPKNTGAFINRGNFYFVARNYPAAIKDYTKAIEMEPSYTLYTFRAMAYDRIGEKDKAQADRQQSGNMKDRP